MGTLHGESVKLGRIPLIIVDAVGYIPFETEAAIHACAAANVVDSIISRSKAPSHTQAEVTNICRCP